MVRATAARVGAALGICVLVVAAGLGIVLAMESDDDDRPMAQGDEEDESTDEESDDEQGGDPIASATLGTMVVDVLQLERTSDTTVTLRFRLVNEGTEDFEIWDNLGEELNDATVGGVYLIDEPGGKKYLSLRDTEGGCICTELASDIENVDAGEAREFFVKFPAPPDDVEAISVGIPTVGAVDNVEISG